MKKKIEFNVIYWDVNAQKFTPYDIIPYLSNVYKNKKKKKRIDCKTFDEFKKFILGESMYQWWSRCEYEIILKDWPCLQTSEKWDIHRQVEMNIDVITKLFMELFPIKTKKNDKGN